ncbi:porin family protein [Aquirufa ecclesiirivi]|uniref:porin family protein n=1 Tax=Aquirufa ecclesiirivi TaxID=2715124 RepID=UPI003BB1B629
MKKILFFALLISLSNIHLTQGQSSTSRFWDGFKLGIKAGANFSNVYDTQGEAFKADGKVGFVGGAFLEVPLSDYLGIRPEVLYSQKGFQASGQYLGMPYSFTRTTDYIDIPILLTIKPVSMLTINAGPQFSFLMKQKDVFTSTLLSNQQQQDFSNDNYRKNLMSITAGIGLNFGIVILDLRANYDLQQNNGDGTTTTPRYKNAWYQATLGFRII